MTPTKKTDKKKNRPLVIGITGGVGTGKSTIVECICRNFDCEYINSDKLAHLLMEPGKANHKALIKEYGEGIIDKDNPPFISRQALLQAVTSSEAGFKRLNDLTHPNVCKESKRIISNTGKKVVILEAALLLEAGMDKICDDVWCVSAPTADRVRRLKETRGYSDEKIESLINNQLSDEEFKKRTDLVINNPDGSDEGKKTAIMRVKELLDGKLKKD